MRLRHVSILAFCLLASATALLPASDPPRNSDSPVTAPLFWAPKERHEVAPMPRERGEVQCCGFDPFVQHVERVQPKAADAPGADVPPPPKPKKPRGLKPTPKHKLFAIKPFVPDKAKATPASVAYVPAKLSMWLNDTYGDCVTAEEAFNQDVMGAFITDQTVLAWARKHGYLNGAMLTDVMDTMAKTGFSQGGNVYGIGPYLSVNFGDEPTLQAALAIAPVKIGIDANALPQGAGNASGWYATGGSVGEFSNEDHCVSLAGYGTAQTLYSSLNVPLPANIQPTATGYLLFTWNTIGFVDHPWLMSTCAEAYVRNPSGTVNGKPQPNPGPGPQPVPPTPTPVPPVPPTPTPTFPGIQLTVGPDTFTFDTTKKQVTLAPGWTLSGGSADSLGKELSAAGVNPAVIADVLKLALDLKAKAGLTVIMGDLAQLLKDLSTPTSLAPPRRRIGVPEWALAA